MSQLVYRDQYITIIVFQHKMPLQETSKYWKTVAMKITNIADISNYNYCLLHVIQRTADPEDYLKTFFPHCCGIPDYYWNKMNQ